MSLLGDFDNDGDMDVMVGASIPEWRSPAYADDGFTTFTNVTVVRATTRHWRGHDTLPTSTTMGGWISWVPEIPS